MGLDGQLSGAYLPAMTHYGLRIAYINAPPLKVDHET